MSEDLPRNWSGLLWRAIKRSWPWLVSAIVTSITFFFGDLRGYLAIAGYVAPRTWIIYVLLCIPLICIALGVLLKVVGDELIRVGTESDTPRRPLYKRVKMHATRQFQLDGVVRGHNEVEVQVIDDMPLRSIRHRRTIVEAGAFQEADLDFESGYRDGKGDMRARIIHKSSKVITWAVEFTPPLLKGQRATYSYKQRSRGTFPMTLEEIHEQLMAGQRSKDHSGWRFYVVVPTDQLYMKIEFAPGYEITLPRSGGLNVYLVTNEYEVERNRLMAEGAFSAELDRLTNRWRMELSVTQAQMGLGYVLEWIPPTKAIVEALTRGAA